MGLSAILIVVFPDHTHLLFSIVLKELGQAFEI